MSVLYGCSGAIVHALGVLMSGLGFSQTGKQPTAKRRIFPGELPDLNSIAVLEQFQMERKMTKTGIFRAIEPIA